MIQYKGVQASISIKETIRLIDAMEEEKLYAKKKYPNHYELIDYEAHNCFISGTTMIVMLKCTYGFNQYATRDRTINYGQLVKEYPCCSNKEIWSHVIQCR